MITKWKVKNFKSIRKETELDFAPLTIFAGANSSGKSTFIQSILLFAQSLTHKVSSRPIVLNGSFASLGQFDDLKSNDSEIDRIEIKCTCSPILEQEHSDQRRRNLTAHPSMYYRRGFSDLQEITCEIAFESDSLHSQKELFQIQPRLYSTRLSCNTKDEDSGNQELSISISRLSKAPPELEESKLIDGIKHQIDFEAPFSVELDEISMSEVKEDFHSVELVGSTVKHFLPNSILCEIDTLMEDAIFISQGLQDELNLRPYHIRHIRRYAGSKIPLTGEIISILRNLLNGVIDFDDFVSRNDHQESGFEFDSKSFTLLEWRLWLRSLPSRDRKKIRRKLRDTDDLFDQIYTALKSSKDIDNESKKVTQIPLPGILADANRYLEYQLGISLRYLGPLRDEPKPLYPLAPAANPNDVGLRGEHTAFILELHKNKRVEYLSPKNFRKPQVSRKLESRALEIAVVDWLKYLGVANSVKSRDQGKLGHELKVGLIDSNISHDLTHVGVGVSQVLPILVMCLLASKDSTLVFEQPELHLHPKVQTLLGDFFLSMALCNKQCIVETHSEYLIDRLRYRIASATIEDELTNQMKIYFVEKPQEDSKFREVEINEFGAITDWPVGFFDQSQQQAEEILIAATKKRKSKR